MALPTWQEVLARTKRSSRLEGPIIANPEAAKKYFDWLTKNSYALPEWRKLPRAEVLKRITQLVNMHLNNNQGRYVEPTRAWKIGQQPGYTYDDLFKNNSKNQAALKSYFETPSTGSPRTPKMLKIAKMKIPLREKWSLLDRHERNNARSSIERFLARKGKLTLQEFAPLTNFKATTIRQALYWGGKNIDKAATADEYRQIANGRRFINFFKDNNIEVFNKGFKTISFWPPNKAQQKALDNFENTVTGRISKIDREILERHSRQHPLYKDTSKNLRAVLKAARNNLNQTIEGFNNKGLTRFLKRNPNMLKNATMWFNNDTGTFTYTRPDQLKPGFNFGQLRKDLTFEIEHNRSVKDYWNKMSKDGRMLTKYKLLNDAEFAHNVTVDTMRYNTAKEQAVKWIESNPIKTTQIANIEAELGKLGHRFYAGDKWRGRALDIKSGYRDTILDSWTKALKQSSGLNLKDFTKTIDPRTWTRAMKEVEHSPKALRQLGTFLGCPGTFAAEGGRIGFQTGGTGLTACVNTKLKQPGAIEKIAALPEEVGGVLGKLKNTATTFLGMLGRGGVKAAPYAALAALGAVAEPLVKPFRNDDYSTYLSDENQQKGMLLAMVEAETPKVDEEILKWQYPGMAGAAAAAIPGSGAMMKARKAKGFGLPRQALGPVGKFLAGSFSPLGVAATLPISVAAQVKGGSEIEDIATDPFNWMAPAFASAGARMATRGMAPTGILAKAIRMGMSPATLRAGSRFLGMPGLALSAGLTGYDWWKNRGKDKDDEFKVRTYKDDDD